MFQHEIHPGVVPKHAGKTSTPGNFTAKPSPSRLVWHAEDILGWFPHASPKTYQDISRHPGAMCYVNIYVKWGSFKNDLMLLLPLLDKLARARSEAANVPPEAVSVNDDQWCNITRLRALWQYITAALLSNLLKHHIPILPVGCPKKYPVYIYYNANNLCICSLRN